MHLLLLFTYCMYFMHTKVIFMCLHIHKKQQYDTNTPDNPNKNHAQSSNIKANTVYTLSIFNVFLTNKKTSAKTDRLFYISIYEMFYCFYGTITKTCPAVILSDDKLLAAFIFSIYAGLPLP